MNKLIVAAIATLATLLLFSGCNSLRTVSGTGNMVVHTIDLTAGFTGIDIAGGYIVIWTQSDSPVDFNVTLEIQENLFGYVRTSVRNGIFVLDSTVNFSTSGANTPVLRISAPYLNSLLFTGSVIARDWDEINTDRLDIDISGSARIELSGRAERLNVDMSGSATINAFDLVVTRADIEISGSGNMEIHVTDTLNIDIAGSGNITYDGDPQINRSVAGSGRINRR